MTLPAGSSKGKSKLYIIPIIAVVIMIVIGIDLYNKLQPPDQIIELLDGDQHQQKLQTSIDGLNKWQTCK